MAVITADGGYHGWLGGNCTQPTVKREARRALAEGTPRLISLSPEPPREPRPGVTGAADDLPQRRQRGHLPRARAAGAAPAPLRRRRRLLVRWSQLGKAMGYLVDVVDPAVDRAAFPGADRVLAGPSAPELRTPGGAPGACIAVVATMGERDEDSVAAALALEPAYLGVVASRKRFAELRGDAARARRAGGGARPDPEPRGPRHRRAAPRGGRAQHPRRDRAAAQGARHAARAGPGIGSGGSVGAEREELDPVCGMTVAVATARHQAEHEGRTWYFCNARCREKFLAAPARYLAALAARKALDEAEDPRPPGGDGPRGLHRRRGDRHRASSSPSDAAASRSSSRATPASARPRSPRCWRGCCGTELIRLQCYEGLDVSTALYEWNYPRQMLRVRMAEGEGRDAGRDRSRPSSAATTSSSGRCCAPSRRREGPAVLLIDEVDRADEAFEAFLLEVLSDFQVTIPELGTIRAEHVPHVVLTSNCTREIGDALRRRCLYLYLEHPSLEKEVRILRARVPGASEALALGDWPLPAGPARSGGCRAARAWRRASTGRRRWSRLHPTTSMRRWCRRRSAASSRTGTTCAELEAAGSRPLVCCRARQRGESAMTATSSCTWRASPALCAPRAWGIGSATRWTRLRALSRVDLRRLGRGAPGVALHAQDPAAGRPRLRGRSSRASGCRLAPAPRRLAAPRASTARATPARPGPHAFRPGGDARSGGRGGGAGRATSRATAARRILRRKPLRRSATIADARRAWSACVVRLAAAARHPAQPAARARARRADGPTCGAACGGRSPPAASWSGWRAGRGRSRRRGWWCSATRAARWTRMRASCSPSSRALKRVAKLTEVFAFNTELVRHHPVALARASSAPALAPGRGGARLVRRHAHRREPGRPSSRATWPQLVDARTVVVVLSDGLDARRPRAARPGDAAHPRPRPPGDLAEPAARRPALRAHRAWHGGCAPIRRPPRARSRPGIPRTRCFPTWRAETMALEISKTFVVKALPSQVWDFLVDPQRVARCMPGAAITETAGRQDLRRAP